MRLLPCIALVVGLGSTALAGDRSSQPPKPLTTSARLDKFYAKTANYAAVKRSVLEWHGTTRNGCVAFASTALRAVGVAIPLDEKREGAGVSRITYAFSSYLENDLAWVRVSETASLAPGDLVFTTGWPDHVFMFHSWQSKKKQIAIVVDNYGAAHQRELVDPVNADTSPFAYALRPAIATK
jgi:hypothetical protein